MYVRVFARPLTKTIEIARFCGINHRKTMICLQKATTNDTGRILVTSDLADPEAARKETEAWLRVHGYETVDSSRPLLVYKDGVCVRRWVQAEPCFPAPPPSENVQKISTLFTFLLRPLPGFASRLV